MSYSRRFKLGMFSYPTSAFLEDDVLIIEQTEIVAKSGLRIGNCVMLPLDEFHRMVKELGLAELGRKAKRQGRTCPSPCLHPEKG